MSQTDIYIHYVFNYMTVKTVTDILNEMELGEVESVRLVTRKQMVMVTDPDVEVVEPDVEEALVVVDAEQGDLEVDDPTSRPTSR